MLYIPDSETKSLRFAITLVPVGEHIDSHKCMDYSHCLKRSHVMSNIHTCLNNFLGKKAQLIIICIVLPRIEGSGLRTYKMRWKVEWFLEPNEVEVLRKTQKSYIAVYVVVSVNFVPMCLSMCPFLVVYMDIRLLRVCGRNI